MHCLIVGAGAIGVAVGATLFQAGCTVSFYARGATKEAIAAGGVRRTGLFGPAEVPPDALTVADDYGAFPPDSFDYVLISVKAMANPAVAAALAAHREILKPEGRLVLMQNGWGNDGAYLDYFSKEQVCSARVITGFQRTAPNVSNVTVHTAPILLGSLYGLDVSPLEPLARCIDAGGIPCQVTDDVTAALWAKMLYNCALNPLGAVLGVHYGALGESAHTVAIMNDLIDEVFAVMTAAGYVTYWATPEDYRKEFYGKLLPDTYHHNSSTLQDLRRHQPTEIDALTGKILELAEAHRIPVPANTMLYRQVKAIEEMDGLR
ncbi:MAG: 2-dehydropantoate 2-reductase [Clostridiales bacterium]|nr:2-dehydropantoate 2-reductase [Clostridiales bacterium]